MQLDLPVQPPFNLRSVIYSHGWVQLAPFCRTETGFRHVVALGSGRVVVYTVEEDDGQLRVLTDCGLTDGEAEELRDRASWMLGLDQDFTDFYRVCRGEPKLRDMEREAKGRILRSPDLFEDVVKTILTTNTSWSGTLRMTQALVDNYGSPADESSELRAFPAPTALAGLTETELREVAKLGYRAPYVLELAQRIASGELDLESVKQSDEPTAELRKRLLEIKGIGGYAAANLLMLLGRYDYLPIDSWARTCVSNEWHDGEPVGEKEINAAFEQWGQWKALAYNFWKWDETP